MNDLISKVNNVTKSDKDYLRVLGRYAGRYMGIEIEQAAEKLVVSISKPERAEIRQAFREGVVEQADNELAVDIVMEKLEQAAIDIEKSWK